MPAIATGLTLQELAALNAASLTNALRSIPDALLLPCMHALGTEKVRAGIYADAMLLAHEAEARAQAARAAGNRKEARELRRFVQQALRHARQIATS